MSQTSAAVEPVAIVTGAGSGIGAATAARLTRDGYRVVLADLDEAKLREVAASIGEDRALVHVTDVAEQAQVVSLIDAAVERFGRLDLLVNNAGTAVQAQLEELTLEDWRKVMATDVDSVFYACQAAVKHLKESKGSIVNVSSVSGTGGDWGMSAYNAAKGAVSNFTRALAMDLGEFGVRVNAVNPTFTRTAMTGDAQQDDELVEAMIARIPLGRAGEAEDVADVIAFLASRDARFVSGVNLPVDGGLSASNGQARQA